MMYEKLKQLILDLDGMNLHPFIGYGNPDARLLIVGKECASPEGSEEWKKFYMPNFIHWKESFEGHGFGFNSGKIPYDFDNGNFHPIFPFYQQRNKIRRKEGENATSATYYYYQRLVDKIRRLANPNYKSPEHIDFFESCFITELNDISRLNDKNLKKREHEEIEQHIRERFDWMRRTNYFNQFKVVILACGPYAKAINNDEKLKTDLFGKAYVVHCHQLSFWDKSLDEKIAKIFEELNM